MGAAAAEVEAETASVAVVATIDVDCADDHDDDIVVTLNEVEAFRMCVAVITLVDDIEVIRCGKTVIIVLFLLETFVDVNSVVNALSSSADVILV